MSRKGCFLMGFVAGCIVGGLMTAMWFVISMWG